MSHCKSFQVAVRRIAFMSDMCRNVMGLLMQDILSLHSVRMLNHVLRTEVVSAPLFGAIVWSRITTSNRILRSRNTCHVFWYSGPVSVP